MAFEDALVCEWTLIHANSLTWTLQTFGSLHAQKVQWVKGPVQTVGSQSFHMVVPVLDQHFRSVVLKLRQCCELLLLYCRVGRGLVVVGKRRHLWVHRPFVVVGRVIFIPFGTSIHHLGFRRRRRLDEHSAAVGALFGVEGCDHS